METPSRHSFDLDGSLRIFPIPSPIKGDNYCRLEVDSVIVNDRAKYDIVNNSIVFLSVADVPNGSVLDVLVVQSEESIGQLAISSNMDIVAQNIDDINIVGSNIADVNTVADADTVVTIFPYLDFFATKSKLVPRFLNTVVIQSPLNNSKSADPVPLICILPFVPLLKSIVTAFDPIVYKFIVLGSVGYFKTSAVRKRNSTLCKDCE